MRRNILLVDDQPEWLNVIQDILAQMNIEIATASNRAELEHKLDTKEFGLVVLDVRLDETADLEIERTQTAKMLAHLKEHHKNTKCIILTAYATLSFALQVIRDFKPFDFFVKDDFSEQMSRFQVTVIRALEPESEMISVVQESKLPPDGEWLRSFELEKRKQELITQLIECLKKTDDQLVVRWSKRIEAKGGRANEADAIWITEQRKALENQYREASSRVHRLERIEDLGPVQLWLTRECNQWLNSVVASSN